MESSTICIPSCPNWNDDYMMIQILKSFCMVLYQSLYDQIRSIFDQFLIKFDQLSIKIQLKCQLKDRKWSKLIEKVKINQLFQLNLTFLIDFD